jgi:hypothetical protein
LPLAAPAVAPTAAPAAAPTAAPAAAAPAALGSNSFLVLEPGNKMKKSQRNFKNISQIDTTLLLKFAYLLRTNKIFTL